MANLLVRMRIVGAGSDPVHLEIGPLDVGCVVVDRAQESGEDIAGTRSRLKRVFGLAENESF